MKKLCIASLLLLLAKDCCCWGFYAHKKINYYACFLLPPEMMLLYKSRIDFLAEHSVDPDKRRYAVPGEGARHYIDLDQYGSPPFASLPRKWNEAAAKYSEDSLKAHGILPWWLQTMFSKLTEAFREKNEASILKYSAEIGHYIADAHVPLHTNSNHNGQYTGQKGIHAFWESRVPELLAEKEWDFFIGRAAYISNPVAVIWKTICESAAAADTVLKYEKLLTKKFSPDQKYSFEERNGVILRQYSSAFTRAYDALLRGMVERRMRQSIHTTASFWYTAWINAGQPDLSRLHHPEFSPGEMKEFEQLNRAWKEATVQERDHND